MACFGQRRRQRADAAIAGWQQALRQLAGGDRVDGKLVVALQEGLDLSFSFFGLE